MKMRWKIGSVHSTVHMDRSSWCVRMDRSSLDKLCPLTTWTDYRNGEAPNRHISSINLFIHIIMSGVRHIIMSGVRARAQLKRASLSSVEDAPPVLKRIKRIGRKTRSTNNPVFYTTSASHTHYGGCVTHKTTTLRRITTHAPMINVHFYTPAILDIVSPHAAPWFITQHTDNKLLYEVVRDSIDGAEEEDVDADLITLRAVYSPTSTVAPLVAKCFTARFLFLLWRLVCGFRRSRVARRLALASSVCTFIPLIEVVNAMSQFI